MKKIVCLMVLALVLAGGRVAFCISGDSVPPGDSATPEWQTSFHELMYSDGDSDGIIYMNDNCPSVANPGQEDMDDDGEGDLCDTDNDNDGVVNTGDNCPLIANVDQADGDADGIGDACDGCPEDADVSHQAPTACDEAAVESDTDGDGVTDDQDNCLDQIGTAENLGCPAELDLSPPAEVGGYDEGGSCSLAPMASACPLAFVFFGAAAVVLVARRKSSAC